MVNVVGISNMVIQTTNGPSATSYIRFRSEYADTTLTGDPALADTKLVFVSPRVADADIAVLPAQSTWKFDYYLTTNNSTTPDATQYYKTVGRALTIAEFKTQPLFNLTDGDIASLKASTNTNSVIPLAGTGPFQLDWSVGAGALAPTSIKIFGRSGVSPNRFSFDDGSRVGSTARTGKIICSSQFVSDTHCTSTNGVSTFSSATDLTGLHLFSSDSTLHEFAHFYAPYKVVIQ